MTPTAGELLLRDLLPPPVRPRTRVGRRWIDMSLRHKVLSVVALISLVCTPPIAVGLVVQDRLQDARQATRQTTDTVEALVVLEDMVLLRGHRAIVSFVISGFSDQAHAEEFRSITADAPRLLAELAEDVPADLEVRLAATIAAYEAELVSYGAVASLGPDTILGPGSGAALDAANVATRAAFVANDELGDALDERLADQRAAVDRQQGLLVRSMLVSLALALGAALAGIHLVTSSMVRRIEQLSDNAARFLRKDRMTAVMPSRDEIGELNHTMAVTGIMQEERRAEALAATRAKDNFLSRISQELKAPVTAMISLARQLEDDLSPQGREDVAHIVGAGRHLEELIEEMLDIKAIEAGRLAVTIEPVDVAETAAAAVELVQPAAARRSVSISTDCPPGLVVAADRRRLREVLLNLLSNAVKYNHEHGHVEVRAAPGPGGVVRISVADTGPGITPDDQGRLFLPFERLGAASSGVEGTGIGLSLTKHVVEAMGGSIGVESTPNRGATFWFDLPVPAAEGA